MERAREVSSFFGLRKKVDEKAIERFAIAKARADKRAQEAYEKRQKESEERYKEQLAQELRNYEAWKAGETGVGAYFHSHPVAFRVENNGRDGDELVSTLGARVPLQAARVAYRFAMSKRGQAWRENGETCEVGHYRLNAINEHGIVAGCHRIAWAELERLASVLA